MTRFSIGIVGGAGGMGQWFASFFRQAGYPVVVSGRSAGPGLRELAERCSVVIVGVPMEATDGLIRTVGPLMKTDSLLMDLTSLKAAPVRAMLESSLSEVIGLHPLFGPRVASLRGQNIAICPARGERWLPWLRNLLNRKGAILVETTPEEHDRMMALVQALNHVSTLLLGLTLAEQGASAETLRRFSTPLFRDRLDHLDRILSRPGLYAGLIARNPRTDSLLGRYESHLAALRDLVRRGDFNALKERIAGLADLFTGP